MGSIQALRSEALAMRAKEDTNLQVSGFLGGVNKSLGSQIIQLIDQLQGVVAERTKAYNQLVAKINKSINGGGGIGESGVKLTFSLMARAMDLLAIVKNFTTVTDPSFWLSVAKFALDAAGSYFQTKQLQFNFDAAAYDYERMISQLGNLRVDGSLSIPSQVNPTEGAVELLEKRDALMPRFKMKDQTYDVLPAGGTQFWSSNPSRGYVGTLRRL